MRFASIIAAAAMASAAAATPLTVRKATCDAQANEQQYTDNLICPVVINLQQFLNNQADVLEVNTATVLEQVNEVLTSSAPNPANKLVSTLTSGLVRGVVVGVSATLKGVAAELTQLDPKCQCNLVVCNNQLQDAMSQCAVYPDGTGNAQEACNQAAYVCAPFYDRATINKMASCCSKAAPPSNGE